VNTTPGLEIIGEPSGLITAIAFDSIQSLGLALTLIAAGITHNFETVDQANITLKESFAVTPRDFIYLLTPANFGELTKLIRSQASQNPIAQHIVVTEVPTLALLGLSKRNFPQKTLFLRLDDLLEIMKSSAKIGFHQLREIDDFFDLHPLSKTQVKLLVLIATGNTNAEIAREMVLTEKGVESAIKRLAIKLDCTREGEKPQNLRILLGRRYAQLLGVL
jgi:DNA-binding NarL/FixJ family response regulator